MPRSEAMQEAIRSAVSARNLCGNEYEAAQTAFSDYGERMTELQWAEVSIATEVMWNDARRQAGVPIR